MAEVGKDVRVEAISEALPFIKRYHGKRVLAKIGGSALVQQGLLAAFARDVSLLAMVGIRIVVVHGGGPQIGSLLQERGIPVRKSKGIRITDGPTLAVVEEVLAGSMNKAIVGAIEAAGMAAAGLNGSERHLLHARRKVDPEVDYGLVGTVISVNTASVNDVHGRAVPVIAPLGVGAEGETLNINGDEAAAALAVALGCEVLLFLTDSDGVLNESGATVPQMAADEAARLAKDGTIADGMAAKVEFALQAVAGGVGSTRIINGGGAHALLLELLTDEGVGTMIKGRGT